MKNKKTLLVLALVGATLITSAVAYADAGNFGQGRRQNGASAQQAKAAVVEQKAEQTQADENTNCDPENCPAPQCQNGEGDCTAQCPNLDENGEPACDGSGCQVRNQNGNGECNGYGDCDGTGQQLHQRLRDGSGEGGHHGRGNCDGSGHCDGSGPSK